MKNIYLILVLFLWACSGGGSDSPTEPTPPQLPTVQNIEFTTAEDTAYTFAFSGTDPLNQALTYSISTQPQHGTISINAGAGTYTPNANYNGSDSFAYLATSINGNSNIGTIVATITPVDDEPSTMDVSATTDEDNSVQITLEAEEYDGDNIEFQLKNNPSNGSVEISGNVATYTPNENWFGTDQFNFEAVDSNARSVINTATATVTVNSINDQPVIDLWAGNMSGIDSDGKLRVNGGVKKSIYFNVSDIEDANLSASFSSPNNGSITEFDTESNERKGFYYTSNGVGQETISFYVEDSEGLQSESYELEIITDRTYSFTNKSRPIPASVIFDGQYLVVFGGVRDESASEYNPFCLVVDLDGNVISESIISNNYMDLAGDNQYGNMIDTVLLDNDNIAVFYSTKDGNGTADIGMAFEYDYVSHVRNNFSINENYSVPKDAIKLSNGNILLLHSEKLSVIDQSGNLIQTVDTSDEVSGFTHSIIEQDDKIFIYRMESGGSVSFIDTYNLNLEFQDASTGFNSSYSQRDEISKLETIGGQILFLQNEASNRYYYTYDASSNSIANYVVSDNTYEDRKFIMDSNSDIIEVYKGKSQNGAVPVGISIFDSGFGNKFNNEIVVKGYDYYTPIHTIDNDGNIYVFTSSTFEDRRMILMKFDSSGNRIF